MKKVLIIISLTAILFVALTLLTAKIERPFDGNDTFGYPLTFLIKFSGMCDPCPPNLTETNYWKLLLDIGFSIILALLIWKAFDAIRTRVRNSNA